MRTKKKTQKTNPEVTDHFFKYYNNDNDDADVFIII